VVSVVTLAYLRTPIRHWAVVGTLWLGAGAFVGQWPIGIALAVIGTFVVAMALLSPGPLRRNLVARPLLASFRGLLPPMSQTEREALEAGTVWWEGDLFRGDPDWNKLLSYPQPKLTGEEQSFLDNETEQLCSMVSEWETSHILYDLPPHVWQFIKDKGFLGMIIPRKYGGKEFSA